MATFIARMQHAVSYHRIDRERLHRQEKHHRRHPRLLAQAIDYASYLPHTCSLSFFHYLDKH